MRHSMIMTSQPQPNNSPEPNPMGAFSYARTPVAHLAFGSGWLSFFR